VTASAQSDQRTVFHTRLRFVSKKREGSDFLKKKDAMEDRADIEK
jgi:hypothetical protein